MRILAVAVALFLSVCANAIPIVVGDSVRVDFQTSDWMGGTGDALRLIGPRIGFCGVPAFTTGAYSGDADCDFTADDEFRLSIFSDTDELLYAQLDPANGSVGPNTWQNNIGRGGGNVFPLDGYLLLEVTVGAFDFNEILLIGVEATPPGFIVGTPLLGFSVIPGGGGPNPVPEPGTLTLFALGLLGLGMRRKRA